MEKSFASPGALNTMQHLPLVQLVPSERSEQCERAHDAPDPAEEAEPSERSDHTVGALRTSFPTSAQSARADAETVDPRACLIPTHHNIWKNGAGHLICQICHPRAGRIVGNFCDISWYLHSPRASTIARNGPKRRVVRAADQCVVNRLALGHCSEQPTASGFGQVRALI